MPPRPVDRYVPRLALTQVEAATALGMSLATFKRRVAPVIGCVHAGSARLYPISELERWIVEQTLHPSDAERNVKHKPRAA